MREDVPASLVEPLPVGLRASAVAWWDSLTPEQRGELTELSTTQQHETATLLEEGDGEGVGAEEEWAVDLYEFLVSHDIRPVVPFFLDHGLPVFGVPLLSPLWPPYPVEARFRPWRPDPRWP